MCGLRSRLNCPEFVNYITKFDILVFVETKTDKQDHSYLVDKFSDLNYFISIKSRKYLSYQRSGGIAVAVKKKCVDGVKFLTTTSNCATWFSLKQSLTGFDKELLVGAIYVPPEGTLYSSVDLFDEIESDLADLRSKEDRNVLLMGDFNAYTKSLADYIDSRQFDDDVVLDKQIWNLIEQSDLSNRSELFCTRVSQDKHRPNNFGYRLLELCKEFSIMILNGRAGSDANIGMCTSNGCTVVDYIIGSPSLFPMIQDFSIEPFDALLSDVHTPLVLTLKTGAYKKIKHSEFVVSKHSSAAKDSLKETVNVMIRKWQSDKADVFQQHLATYNIEELNEIIDSELSVNDANKQLVRILIDSAKSALGTTKRKLVQHESQRKGFLWFDFNCKQKRREYFAAKHKAKRHKSVVNLEELKIKSKAYKSCLKISERKMQNNWHRELRSLKSKNPKVYWKRLQRKKRFHCPIELECLYKHFKFLNVSEREGEQEGENIYSQSILDNLDNEYDLEGLNTAITEDEVNSAIKRLKSGRAAGEDLVYNEYIKHSTPLLSKTYCKLFNKVLDTGDIPDEWVNGLILPLYKGRGSETDCNNYRGITLLSCVGKLFTSILNDRLSEFIESNKILSENQAGFRKYHSTLDHIFVLKSLIDVYAAHNRKLFCAFVDFKKAFDTVWRQGLWTKLIKEGIDGKVLHVITNMYKRIKSCVFLRSEKSDFFGSYRGVRQGENLSPVLFSLYLNDMENFFCGAWLFSIRH